MTVPHVCYIEQFAREVPEVCRCVIKNVRGHYSKQDIAHAQRVLDTVDVAALRAVLAAVATVTPVTRLEHSIARIAEQLGRVLVFIERYAPEIRKQMAA